MAATERLTIEMRAQDRASAGIRKVKGELGGLKAKGQEAAAGLSSAFGALGLAFHLEQLERLRIDRGCGARGCGCRVETFG